MLNTLMNKMMVVLMAGVMLGLGGCAGISPTKVPQQMSGTADHAYKLAKNGSGVLYGLVLNSPFNHDVTTAKFACDAINNTDERCSHPDDYVLARIATRSQYWDGVPAIMIFMDKNKAIEPCWNFSNNKTCTYVKVQMEKGKLGTVLEVASVPGDDKCHWSGGGVGGVVCGEWDSAREVRTFHTTSSTTSDLIGVDEN